MTEIKVMFSLYSQKKKKIRAFESNYNLKKGATSDSLGGVFLIQVLLRSI